LLHSRSVGICLSAKFHIHTCTVFGSPQHECWPAGSGCVTGSCQLPAFNIATPTSDMTCTHPCSRQPFFILISYRRNIAVFLKPSHNRWGPESEPVHRNRYPQACPGPKPISGEPRDSSTSSTSQSRPDCSSSNSAIFKRKNPCAIVDSN